MAGSYNHLVGEDGKFTFDLIENMGDAYEACEECFDIIKKLTSDNSGYAKCIKDIMMLDELDAIVNKEGVLYEILKKHFA